MDIIINAACQDIPQGASEFVSQGAPLLNLLACLDYDPANPPLAELLSRYYQLERDWLILSPVHWHATHNNAVITACGPAMEVSEQELKKEFHRFSEHLMNDGVALYYHDPYIWLLSTHFKNRLKAKPVHQVLNQPIMFELAGMDETLHWQKFLTESQMFFAMQPTHSMINGVWLWGSGRLGAKKQIRICSDLDFLKLAQECATHVSVYQPHYSLKDFDVLLLQDLSLISAMHQEQLTTLPVRWYWNNIGYSSKKTYWFTRLWRTLIHAY